ncbi:hypothetical protein K7X08_014377 [Anisodus acutangulus]|uniref:Protein kinase domain-containing protein n=1 Tax=Anisodus acutangulus TaxID=402998 RepID=A0A9Q1R329_9SOLA|nr:hypothetical protein K7X08_014377 [Anisodus acutangulus]
MKLGIFFKTRHEVYLSTWKNDNDPTPGEFTLHVDLTGYPQALIRHGTKVFARAGSWNGLRWSGAPAPLQIQSSSFTFQFVFNKVEVYYSFSLINSSLISRLVLTNNGYVQWLAWVDRTKSWQTLNIPLDTCDTYSLCGAYGDVINSSPVCGCLEKFVPKYPQQWETGDWSGGCVGRKPYHCNKEHVFLKYSGIKLPDTEHSQYDKTMTLEGCRQKTLWKRTRHLYQDSSELVSEAEEETKEELELPMFQLPTITRATNNFAVNKNIGEGGFGPVYKGVLEEGQEIAMKRLSRTSMQGLDEFKNEVIYTAKLQHRIL